MLLHSCITYLKNTKAVFLKNVVLFHAITVNENLANYKCIIKLVHITCALYCQSSEAIIALCEEPDKKVAIDIFFRIITYI